MKKEEKQCNKVLNFIKRICKERELVETTISLRTKNLAKEVKNLCDFNFKLALLALFSALITAMSTIDEFWKVVLDYFSGNSKESEFPYFGVILCTISLGMILLALYSFFKQFKMYNPTKFVNHIIEEQYDTEEYTAIFVIKAMFENIPKILVFRSETWNSFFLPYCHYDKKLSPEKIKEKVKVPIAEQLEVEASDIEICDDFSKNTYVTIKMNPSHKSMSKINYRFYYIRFTNAYLSRKFLNNNMKHFSWKSKYELTKDIDTQLNNGDIVSIIDELALINQSKLAFQEKTQNSFEIASRYNIIWNITDKCHFNCPICATNSGKNATCENNYEQKLNILLNLASINGYIEKLDISGGDPLIDEQDRKIIKKANQILSFTDIKVTTTGKAIRELPVEEIVETIKKCDITYDIPYEICNDELKEYREYEYNYSNFKQLEKFSNSGVNVELNIHIPILPVIKEEKLVSMILEDISRVNPSEVKFIRLMPVGRMMADKIQEYSPKFFLNMVNKIVEKNNYKFNITYNCSLGTRLFNREDKRCPVRECSMLKRKLGIDCNGRVYACIWGAYIQEFTGEKYVNNPFYLGDLNERTMYEILMDPLTIKFLKSLEENMKDGCRVCAYVNARMSKNDEISKEEARKIMMEAEDPIKPFAEFSRSYKSK